MKKTVLLIAIMIYSLPAKGNPKINETINDLLNSPVNKTAPDTLENTTQLTSSEKKDTNLPQEDETALTGAGDFSQVLLKTGIQFYHSNLYSRSIKKLNELITTYPQSPYKDSAHLWIGKALIKQYKYNLALEELKKITADSGEFPTALFIMAGAHHLQGDHITAIEMYNRVHSEFASHEIADNALLMSGKISLQNKLGLQALETTITLLKKYKSRETIDEAFYLLAKIFEQDTTLKDIEISRSIYKKFMENVANGKKFFKHSPLRHRVKRDLAYLEQHYFN